MVATPAAVTGDAIPMLAPGGTTGQNNITDIRRGLIQGLFGTRNDGTVRQGVLVKSATPQPLRVTQRATAGQGALVAAGFAIVSRTGEGAYLAFSQQTIDIDLPAASGTNPRYDGVYLRLVDRNLGADNALTIHGAFIDVRSGATGPLNPTGVAGSAGAYPTTPDGWLPLAYVARGTSDNIVTDAEITDARTSAAVQDGVRVLLPGDSVAEIGDYIGELTMTRGDGANLPGFLRRWNGSRWESLVQAAPFIRGELRRSDGQSVLNPQAYTDLKIYGAEMIGAAWSDVYQGRGVSIQESGLYRITATMHTSHGNPYYCAIRYTSGSPSRTHTLGSDSTQGGFGCASGEDLLHVPRGGTLGVTFEGYVNSAGGADLTGGGVSTFTIQKVSEAMA